jgi:aminomethyltransferase
MANKTILNQAHRDLGARMVPFAGWDMPVHYGSQIEEHHAVRKDAGMFDVSHMRIFDLRGSATRALLSSLLANDIAKLQQPGKALYSCMLKEDGGVIDDLIVYYMDENWFRMVVNAGTAEKDYAWIKAQADRQDVALSVRSELAMIAVQGPNAREKTIPLFPADVRESAAQLKPFNAASNDDWFVGRTGYTGEDGFEVLLPEQEANKFWQALIEQGVRPCGLGCRDTLRLEAGMNLYGTDMDESTTPLESGLSWTVALADEERNFIGKDALLEQKESGNIARFIGLILQGRGILRGHQKLFQDGQEIGEITSGGFSPTLEKSIAMARVRLVSENPIEVEIRGKRIPVIRQKLPFVRNGKSCIN